MTRFTNIWRRVAKIIVILYIVVLCLPVFLIALLRTPFIQEYMVQKVSIYLSEDLGTEVSIGAVNINFFFEIIIDDLNIQDKHNNTLASIDRIIVNFRNYSLKSKTIFFQHAGILNPVFHLRQYEGEEINNLQFILDYFATDDTTKTGKQTVKFRIKNVYMRNAEFSFRNENKEKSGNEQIDFNDLHLSKITLFAGNIVLGDTISADIHQFSFIEKSGFRMQNFKSQFKFCNTFLEASKMNLNTGKTNLSGYIKLKYSHTKDFNDFVNLVSIESDFQKSRLDFSDLRSFSASIPPLNSKLLFSGKINGTVSNLTTRNLFLQTGLYTRMVLDCMIIGLPDINETFFDLNIQQLQTRASDIIRILNDLQIESGTFKELNTLARFDIRGSFIGFINSFYADFALNSDIGGISGKMSFKDPDRSMPSYNGKLQTTAFDLGKLLQNDLLGIVTSDLEVNGQGTELRSMKVWAKGTITEMGFNGYNYSGIILNAEMDKGLFDGNINIQDPNLHFDFNGSISFAAEKPSFSFVADVEHANLNKLNLNRNDAPAMISGRFTFNGTGSSPDDFLGQVDLQDIQYHEGEIRYSVQYISLQQVPLGDDTKRLTVESDIADGFLEGKYHFNEIPEIASRFISEYIARTFSDSTTTESTQMDLNIHFDFRVKNFETISSLFIPQLKVSPGTEVNGRFNSQTNALFVSVSSGLLTFDHIKFKNSSFDIETFSKNIYFTAISDKISYHDSLFIENFIGSGIMYSDNINFSLYWDNYDLTSNTSGDLKGFILFPDSSTTIVNMASSNFTYQNRQWRIIEDNSIIFSKNTLQVNNFRMQRENQEITVHGTTSDLITDGLKFTFRDVELENLETILSQFNFAVDGRLNGTVEIKNLFSNLFFTSHLTIGDFIYEQKNYGDILIVSEYNNTEKSLYAEIKSTFSSNDRSYEPLLASGHYYFDRPGNELDFKCKLSALELKLVEPFLAGQLRIIEGKTSGEITVRGDVRKPEVNGSFWFMRGIAHVNYLNTIFVLKDTIHLSQDKIFAKNFQIADGRGKNAYADIMITHNNFNDFRLDIKLQTEEDFVFMNTGPSDNEVFYGTIVANGYVHITGKPDDVLMNISARTGRGTQFFLPMDAASSVYESNFITFVKKGELKELISQPSTKAGLGFRMYLDLEVTPDAEMQIIFDPKIGDIMRGKAKGNLRIDFDIKGDFIMFGELELVDGDYLFTLENVINKRFFIQPGGTIKWEGNPYNAIIDINTFYPTRTRLFELVSHIDSSEIYRKKIPVNLELNLKNNLMTPDISFNITLPQSDENTRNIMKSAISSDQELNRQVFALLILNSFVQPEASFSAPISQGMGTTTLEFVSNQFSNWLSQISKDFDIGVNYRQGSELTTDEVEILFSTQVINERVRIEGNIGVGGNQVGVENPSGQQVLGDVSIEYRLTPDGRIYLRAFNRSNTFDVITENAPYTQGVSVFFRKDFDKLRELFINERRQQKRKQ
jgi:hypothetical protein